MFLVNRVPWRTVRAIVPFSVLAFTLLAAVMACNEPGPTSVPPVTLPPPTETPDPYARPGAQDGAVVSSYWSGPVNWEPEDVSRLERVSQQLVAPPSLPRHEQDYTGAASGWWRCGWRWRKKRLR